MELDLFHFIVFFFIPLNLECRGWNKTFNINNFNFDLLKIYNHLKVILKEGHYINYKSII